MTPRSRLARAVSIGLGLMIANPCSSTDIDLSNLANRGLQLNGIDAGDFSGYKVSGAGDINGDGLADYVISGVLAQPAGEAYVVFGSDSTEDLDLANLSALGRGFMIAGATQGSGASTDVSGAGDVNGDGLADVIIGAPHAQPHDLESEGEAYVVFGKADTNEVDIQTLEDTGLGFKVVGYEERSRVGTVVSGAADVNGDGLDDLLVTAPGWHPDDLGNDGKVYVVFGKASSDTVDLSTLGTSGSGFVVGSTDPNYTIVDASGVADTNGDGLADIAIGATRVQQYSRHPAGYVVFGRTASQPVEIETLSATGQGFVVSGLQNNDSIGSAVSGAGDVNGDGFADIVIGARRATPNGHSSGASYVIFGGTDAQNTDVSNLQSDDAGFAINGEDAFDYVGHSVAGIGDFNGDGFSDLLLGGEYMSPYGAIAGKAYVVWGKNDSETIELTELAAQNLGFQITGVSPNDRTGRALSGVGDTDGDGLADLLVGAYQADPNGLTDAGQSFLVLSNEMPSTTATYKGWIPAGSNSAFYPISFTGNGSIHDTPDSRVSFSFDGGDSSAQTVVLHRTRPSSRVPGFPAAVHWELNSNRTGWSEAQVMLIYAECEVSMIGENNLKIYRADGIAGPWTELATTLEEHRNRAFSEFQAGVFTIADPDAIFVDTFDTPCGRLDTLKKT